MGSRSLVKPLSVISRREDEAIVWGAAPTAINSSLPLSLGFVAALISFLVLQILVIAVAFGTADYGTGRTGLGQGGFEFCSAAAMALSAAIGAGVAAAQLRRADVDERSARRVALLAPGLLTVAVAVNGWVVGHGSGGVLLIGLSGLLGAAPAGRLGARTDWRRGRPR